MIETPTCLETTRAFVSYAISIEQRSHWLDSPDEFVAVTSADHPLAARPYLTARDFADQNLILYLGPDESTLFEKILRPAGVTPARLSKVPLREATIEMAGRNDQAGHDPSLNPRIHRSAFSSGYAAGKERHCPFCFHQTVTS
jgi:LysR substrate binding domain